MRALRPFLAATFALVLAGCGDSSTGPRTDHLGVYDLTSVDGQPLPAVILDDGTNYVAVSAGDMTLGPSNRAIATLTLDIGTGTRPPMSEGFVCMGTHSRSGNTVTITLPESSSCAASTLTATLDGRTLTVSDESGETLVYTKEP